MQDFPHHYRVTASAREAGPVMLSSAGLQPLESAAPAEFGGPGDRWSPETLLAGALADCFILTFRAVARASKLSWHELGCEVSGTLERVERVTKFTAFTVKARLRLAAGQDAERARRLLEKAEENCLISRSLTATVHLDPEIEIG